MSRFNQNVIGHKIVLLRLVHLRVPFSSTVLRRTRRRYRRCIHYCASLEQQALRRQLLIYFRQHLYAQVVPLQSVPKTQNRALVGKILFALIYSYKFTEHRHVIQRFFHPGIGKIEPLLKKVNSQHGLYCKGGTTSFRTSFGGVGDYQFHQLVPRYDSIHFVKKLSLARSLILSLVSRRDQTSLFHANSFTYTAQLCRVSLDP